MRQFLGSIAIQIVSLIAPARFDSEASAPSAPAAASRPVWLRLRDSDALILLGVLVWVALGIALAAHFSARVGGPFTGVLTASPDDSFQFLAWVRDSGLHGLISDNFQVGPTRHDFLQPMFLISGLLWRLGLSLPLAYLVWAPVAAALTWWSFRTLVRRHLAGWAAPAAIVLGLAYMSPLSLWAFYHGSQRLAGMIPLGWESTSITALWGYMPRMVAIACIPLLLVCLEPLVDGRIRSTRSLRPKVVGAMAAAGAAAWLHPWQGLVALAVIAGVGLWARPSRRSLALLSLPALAAAIPLAYYELLEKSDPFWASGNAQSVVTRYALVADAACLIPLAALALLGAERSLLSSTPHRQLLLWLAAACLGYLFLPTDPIHMVNGVTLPLAILAVEGVTSRRARKLRARLAPGRLAKRSLAGLGAIALAASTLPGLYLYVRMFRDAERSRSSGMTFTAQDNRALRYLADVGTPGGVLASPYIAPAVPALAGRQVWAGHFVWTPNYGARIQAASAVFAGQGTAAARRALVKSTGVRYVLVDCLSNERLDRTGSMTAEQRLITDLRGEIVSVHGFGCAAVLQLA